MSTSYENSSQGSGTQVIHMVMKTFVEKTSTKHKKKRNV